MLSTINLNLNQIYKNGLLSSWLLSCDMNTSHVGEKIYEKITIYKF
jgi:hypothetical protein